MPRGFPRKELSGRYDVPTITDDAWHTHSGAAAESFVSKALARAECGSHKLLNAGAGIYRLDRPGWCEFAIDLFSAPLGGRPLAVCGTVERSPFKTGAFGAVVCIGEVLAYCDPAKALAEFSRILQPGGVVVFDFESSRSPRRWMSASFGRAADLVVEEYNGRPERVWIYDPHYMAALAASFGFKLEASQTSHKWSALARRFGVSLTGAVKLERAMSWCPLPDWTGDLIVMAAVKC